MSFPAKAGSGLFDGSGRGTTSANFLELGAGARAAGMGEAYAAVADEASALYWNPAGLTRIEHRSATFTHEAYMESSALEYGAYGQNFGAEGAFGLGFLYSSAGGIAETDQNGVAIGNFYPNDLALSLGYAFSLSGDAAGGLSMGVGLKFIRSQIVNTAETGAVDLGFLSGPMAGGKLRLAAVVTNLGGDLKYESVSEPLPLEFRGAAAYHFSERWIASMDVAAPRDNTPYIALGTEYWLPVGGGWFLTPRGGFNTRTIGGIDGLTGILFGFGLNEAHFGFDYAFLPMGGIGSDHRFSLNYKF